MSKRVDGRCFRVAAGVFLFAAAALVLQSQTRGAEPACECPQVGVPMLSKIPYISRLFKNVGIAHEPCCPEAAWERIGVDFCGDGVCPFQQLGPNAACQVCPLETAAECKAASCQTSCKASACQPSSCATGAAKCGSAKSCCEKVSAASACAKKCCCEECLCDDCDCGRSKCNGAVVKQQPAHWEEMLEIATTNAALEAMLESHEDHLELIEGMAELMVENAKLEAKLEAQAERLELVSEMQQLLAENSRLKAQAELATERAQLTHGALMTSLENEKLKLRVAELELKVGNEARTAARPGAERNAR